MNSSQFDERSSEVEERFHGVEHHLEGLVFLLGQVGKPAGGLG